MSSYLLFKLKNARVYAKHYRSWKKLANELKKEHPYCAICGSKKNLDVHHKIPRHVRPDLILDKDNCVVLCRCCHFRFGHLLDWKKWNMDIDRTIRWVRYDIKKNKLLWESVMKNKLLSSFSDDEA